MEKKEINGLFGNWVLKKIYFKWFYSIFLVGIVYDLEIF